MRKKSQTPICGQNRLALGRVCLAVGLAFTAGELSAAADYTSSYAGFSLASSAQAAARMAASVLATETVDDVDGYPLPPAVLAGAGAPTGGGFIPAASNAPKLDGTAARLGYCAWDNGTSTAAAGRIAGSNSLSVPALAIIAPGLNGVFNTTCADILAGVGTAGNGAKVDDFVVSYSTAQLRNLYSLHVGPAVADTTALNAIAPSSLRDGEVRLVKADNTLRRWDSGSSSWKSAGSSGLSPDAGGNLKAGTNAFALATVATTDTGTDGAIQNILFGKEAGRYLNGFSGFSMWAAHNVGMGYQAMRGDTAGNSYPTNSIAIGYQAMGSVNNTYNNGVDNIAIGRLAMAESVSTLNGNDNIAIGRQAASKMEAGWNNVALGYQSLMSTTSGANNVALGYAALSSGNASHRIGIGYAAASGVTGDYNIGIGYAALFGASASGTRSIAIGHSAGATVSTGGYNTLIGSAADVVTGSQTYATALGAGAKVSTSNTVALGRTTDTTVIGATGAAAANALLQVTGGLYLAPRVQPATNLVAGVINFNSADNTLYYYNGTAWVAAGGSGGGWSPDVNGNLKAGTGAFSSVTTGANNVALGTNAFTSLTTQSNYVGIGNNAGQFMRPTGITPSVAIGSYALNGRGGTPTTNTGSGNVAIGDSAMYGASGVPLTGSNNVAVGASALNSVTTGSTNVAIGYSALSLATTGTTNIAIGYAAMSNTTGGSSNVGIGQVALANVTGNHNVGLAYMALNSTTTGASNIAVGPEAARYNTTGSSNIVFGERALYNNTTGNYNFVAGYYALQGSNSSPISNSIAIGYYAGRLASGNDSIALGNSALYKMGGVGANNNIAMGSSALYGGGGFVTSNTGANNIAMGYQSMMGTVGSGLSGTNNIGLGYQSLLAITSGSHNVALGQNALAATKTGSDHIAIGRSGQGNIGPTTSNTPNVSLGPQALYGQWGTASENTAFNNVAIGYRSMYGNLSAPQTGNSNIAVGYQAFYNFTSGANNIALGEAAMYNATSSSNNFAAGYQALNGWSGTMTGNHNVAIGYQALRGNSTGANNMAFGQAAMVGNSSGSDNVALGNSTLSGNTSGGGNIGIGTGALTSNTTGMRNISLGVNTTGGYGTLSKNTTGSDNIAMGSVAMQSNIDGSSNLAIGNSALFANTTGWHNVALGTYAGYTSNSANANVSGSYNTFIGYDSGPGTATQLTYATALGAGARVTTSGTVVLGRTTDITVVGATAADTSTVGYGRLQVAGAITPLSDNAYDLGSSLQRWATVYAGNGTIQTSDMRLKANISAIQGKEAVDLVSRMRPVRYTWVNPKDGIAPKIGFLAQELATLLPEVVHFPQSANDYYGINYAEITSVLTAAVKQHQELLGRMEVVKGKSGTTSLAINGMLEVDVLRAKEMEAERIKVKTLEAENIEAKYLKAKKVVSGETTILTGGGCAPIFTMEREAVYDVRVMSAQGGWGFMRIGLSDFGPTVQDRKMSENGLGIELNVIGNQVCAMSAISQRANAGWVRVL